MTNDYHIPRSKPKPNKNPRVGMGHHFTDRFPELATLIPECSAEDFGNHVKAQRLPTGSRWTVARGVLAPDGWTQAQADEWAKSKNLKQEKQQ